MYTCNTNMNNPWMGLLNQGLGILGGNPIGTNYSFGQFGQFGQMGFGCSVFTDCNGEINYTKVAGYNTANAVVGVLGQAFNYLQSQKEPKVDYEAEIQRLNETIANLEDINPEDRLDVKYERNISQAYSNLTTLTGEKTKLESALSTETDETKKAEIQSKLNKLNGTGEGSIKDAETKLEEAKTQKEEKLQAIKNDIEEQIKELENKRNEYQSKIDDKSLNKADGNKLQRVSKKDFEAKWKETEPVFEKGDMRYAIAGFRNATTSEDKKEWANKIKTIYNSLDQNKITKEFRQAMLIVKPYLD